MESLNIGNPIVFGLIAGIVTYLILYLDLNYENKKINLNKKNNDKCYCPKLVLSLKIPLIIGSIVWAAANYFESLIKDDEYINNSVLSFEQELFTDQPDF